MRMTGTGEIFRAAAEFDHRDCFGNQFRSRVLQNVRAENAVRLRVGHELDNSLEIFIRQGPGVGAEWELADAIIDSLLFRLILRQPDTSEFRVGVNDSR